MSTTTTLGWEFFKRRQSSRPSMLGHVVVKQSQTVMVPSRQFQGTFAVVGYVHRVANVQENVRHRGTSILVVVHQQHIFVDHSHRLSWHGLKSSSDRSERQGVVLIRDLWCSHAPAASPKVKEKADLGKPFAKFPQVGLLFNEPPGRAGLSFSQSSDRFHRWLYAFGSGNASADQPTAYTDKLENKFIT